MYPPAQAYLNPHQYEQKKQDRVKSDKSWSLLLNSNRELNKNDFPPNIFINLQTNMSEEDQLLLQPLRRNPRATSIEQKSKNSKPKTRLIEKKKTKKIGNQQSGRTTEPSSKKKSMVRRYFGIRENSVLQNPSYGKPLTSDVLQSSTGNFGSNIVDGGGWNVPGIKQEKYNDVYDWYYFNL
jgi:hypothetical protein